MMAMDFAKQYEQKKNISAMVIDWCLMTRPHDHIPRYVYELYKQQKALAWLV